MNATAASERAGDIRLIKALTFAMFLMFAMTTDAVGVIIPEVIKQYRLGMTAAGSFQYATMGGISLSALFLGFLADRLGHRAVIVLGLALFAAASFLFAVGESFGFFVLLLFVSGVGIGIFKTGALALIADISSSTRAHTATMSTVEGFFGVGAIVGPALVAWLLASGTSWKWLYVIAAGLAVLLILGALKVRPPAPRAARERTDPKATLKALGDPFVLAFSLAAMLYVGGETAIYVWMPTYLGGYAGPGAALVPYALSVFFVLRVAGRFLGGWLLSRFAWQTVLGLSCLGVLACFAAAIGLGRDGAVILLPLSGLFMSVIYPTLNSKGISCTPRSMHGAAAGVILFFTCVSAVVAPLAMGMISDAFGDPAKGFLLATGFTAVLALLAVYNWAADPAGRRLQAREAADYAGEPA